MIDILTSIFSWIVEAIKDIVTLIVAIPRYTAMMFTWINAVIPTEILVFFLLMFTAYIIIHIKRLVF